MVVSVDPKIIPLNSKILILFSDPELSEYNGIYTAKDVGGGIKGKHVDLYVGDFKANKASRVAIEFGRQQATLIVLPEYSTN